MNSPIEKAEPGLLFEVPLSQITVPEDRARDLDADWAEALAGLIRAQGLTNPITLRITDGHFRLVTGLHRLEAFRLLGIDEIPAQLSGAVSDDEARLEEVMENLGRNELIALDRCHHLYELKRVYERLYPEAKHGGDHGNQNKGAKWKSLPLASEAGKPQTFRSANQDRDELQIFGFAKATADAIGLGERSIRLAVKIWSDLTRSSRLRLAGSLIARKQSELKLLSEQSAPMQMKVLDLILAATDAPATSVQGALDYLQKGHPVSDVERKFAVLAKSIAALSDDNFDRLVGENEDRIIENLKRRGRI